MRSGLEGRSRNEQRTPTPSPPARADGQGRRREDEALGGLGAQGRGPAETGSDHVARADCWGQMLGGWRGRQRLTGEAGGPRPGRARGSGRRSLSHRRALGRGRPADGRTDACRPRTPPPGHPKRGQAGGGRAGSCCPKTSGDRTPENPTRGGGAAGSWPGSPQLKDSPLTQVTPMCTRKMRADYVLQTFVVIFK